MDRVEIIKASTGFTRTRRNSEKNWNIYNKEILNLLINLKGI